MSAARRWWWLPVALAVLVAAGAGLAGYLARPSAEAIMRVNPAAVDTQNAQRAVDNAKILLDTGQVFDEAARAADVAPDDLRHRTQVATVGQSETIKVTVTSTSPAQAVKEANAVTGAGVAVDSARTQAELELLTDDTRALVAGSRLVEPEAERSRLIGLGTALGDQQSALLASTRRLSVLQPAEPRATVAGPALLAAMGFLGGGLVGLAVALLLGTRRGTLRSGSELRQLYPEAPLVKVDELGTVLSLEAVPPTTVVVAGIALPAEQQKILVHDVAASLSEAGYRVELSEALPRQPRTVSCDAADLLEVVSVPLSQPLLRGVARHERMVLLLGLRPGATRLEWLEEYLLRPAERRYLVLVGEPTTEWTW